MATAKTPDVAQAKIAELRRKRSDRRGRSWGRPVGGRTGENSEEQRNDAGQVIYRVPRYHYTVIYLTDPRNGRGAMARAELELARTQLRESGWDPVTQACEHCSGIGFAGTPPTRCEACNASGITIIDEGERGIYLVGGARGEIWRQEHEVWKYRQDVDLAERLRDPLFKRPQEKRSRFGSGFVPDRQRQRELDALLAEAQQTT